MKSKYIFIILLGVLLIISGVSAADGSGFINSTAYGQIDAGVISSGGSGVRSVSILYINDIETYGDVSLMVFNLPKSAFTGISYDDYFEFTLLNGATPIGTGVGSLFSASSTTATMHLQFDTWDRGALTGDIGLTFSGCPSITWNADSHGGDESIGAHLRGVLPCPQTSSTVYYHTEYSNMYNFDDLSSEGSENGGWLTISRNVLDNPSPSYMNVSENYMQKSSQYATAGNSSYFATENPIFLMVQFPDGSGESKVFYIDYPFTNPTVTPTTTLPTATPTPDISPELCGYWSFAVNTSNVVRMGYVTGTLTEADPDNKHKKIDWYIVLPTGQEIRKKSFMYDDGLFGLGAGWVEVDISTGSASASSEAAAKVNSLQYVIAGNNQHMRVKIYEDKSLIPLAYHDYNLFCTLDQTVHVSETTQGLSVWNINAYDQLTNNLISGITVHLYDYQSGEWQNKTTLVGGSYQFNVVPGNVYRIYIDESYWNTYDEDYTIPSPVPSQPYPVYLIRPLESIPGASWVMFYVRDGSTLNLMGGVSIALSDGQIQSTSGSGFAKFNVSDSTLYYWSASKTGYTGQSGTFNISSDTLLPDVYLYPAGVVTTPTTIPYWTQTPTPLPTYANGTVIPGYTYAPTVTATLNVVERDQKLTESTDIWYRFAPFLSQLIFIVVVVGLTGLMTKSLGGGGSGGRRRRY